MTELSQSFESYGNSGLGSSATKQQNAALTPVPPRPEPLPVLSENIPGALKSLDHWLCWRYELGEVKAGKPRKWTKVPYSARGGRASTTDPRTWSTYEAAWNAYSAGRSRFDGLGIVVTGGVVGLDLDHVVEPGEWSAGEPWAQAVVERFAGTYTELSPSRTGIRSFCLGRPPRSGKGGPEKRLEVYAEGSPRYLTVTGHHLTGSALDVTDQQSALDWLHEAFMKMPGQAQRAAEICPGDATRSDEDVLRFARDARNGAKFSRLWAGDAGDDHSSADLALCNLLAYWSRDAAQIDRLFRRSALMRQKWDEKRGEQTYGEMTIAKALDSALPAPARGESVKRVRPWLCDANALASDTAMADKNLEMEEVAETVSMDDYYAYLPSHRYLYVPTRDLWPPQSIDGHIPPHAWPEMAGKKVKPSRWLDQCRPVHQMTWHPGEAPIIRDRVVDAGGWLPKPGNVVFNLYRPPVTRPGNSTQATRWRDHLRRLYGDDAEHIERWLAHRVQRPGEKINHALVLGGNQGIGKDTLLKPVEYAVGPWNVADIAPTALLGRFNAYVRSVILRISEARDLGESDRFALYDRTKVLIAAPPDVLTVDEKNLREHPVFNVTGVVITSNHLLDGIYLPADDRRHFVAWSDEVKESFPSDYWREFHGWLNDEGCRHVAAFLGSLELSSFDPKAPPPRTAAFNAIVQANHSPGEAELADVLDYLGRPGALTLEVLAGAAKEKGIQTLCDELTDRKFRRQLPHRLERGGYLLVRNPDADDGLWKVRGRRQTIYAKREFTEFCRQDAARALQRRSS